MTQPVMFPMPHPDVEAEQAHVDHAYARLEDMRRTASGRLREAFGERGGTFQALTERDIRVRDGLARLEQLQIGRESLVFGRLDRRGAAPGGGEAFHIGRLAISDVDQEPLVVDWRAPVAEPFYRATGAQPMGLSRRRHFLTEGRRVLDLEDELFGVEGDDDGVGLGLSGPQVLLSALQRSRTGRMRDIVATVQREQDEVIRGPLGGVLVVQGGPGTGKTAVALHRAAYLLYTHRFPLERQGVLVVGPNPTFLRYIAHVLPSLGESGVELSTVSGLFGAPGKLAGEDPAVARLKGDPRMARVLARAVADRERKLRRSLDVPFGRSILRLTPEASEQLVASVRRRPGTHNARRRALETLLWRHFLGQLERRSSVARAGGEQVARWRPTNGPAISEGVGDAADPSEPSEPSDPGLTPSELGSELRRLPEVSEALERMWPLLSPQAFLHDLLGAPALVALAGRGLLGEQEQRLLHRERSPSPAEVDWTDADIPLLDEALALLGPLRRRGAAAEQLRTYGHVVVDEAQDLTPMQLRMLARRSLSGSMTVVGDIAQATGPWAPRTWDEVVEHLPARRGWRLAELTVNYRTPAEIIELARRVLDQAAPGMRPPETVRASGEEPELVSVAPAGVAALGAGVAAPPAGSAPLGAGVAALGAGVPEVVAGRVVAELRRLGPGGGTIGVLVPASLLAPVAGSLVAAAVDFGDAAEGALDAPVSLLTVAEAKGLEFDVVVVAEPTRVVAESPQGLRALYVAVTRATQRLHVVHSEGLPEALRAPPADLPAPPGPTGQGPRQLDGGGPGGPASLN